MAEESVESRRLDALNRILTKAVGSLPLEWRPGGWDQGKSIQDLRKLLHEGVQEMDLMSLGIDSQTATELKSLSASELDKLIDSLNLPKTFGEAKDR